jgi:hypothetical protein
MFRRYKWVGVLGLALTLAISAVPADAQVNATLVLKSGERTTGQLLDHGGVGFTIRVSGEDRRIPTDQVAVVEFTRGDMTEADWAKVSGGTHAVWLRNGEVITGQFYDIGGTAPLNITFKTGAGDRHFSSDEIARIVLARTPNAAATTGTQAAPAAPTTGGGGFVVPAQQQWTSTGLQVRRGEWLTFNTSGEIDLGNADKARAAGSTQQRLAAGAPVPSAFAGALIGRIGNGPAFVIGDRTTMQMPQAGTLFLGINDDHTADNAGEFRVEIQRGRTRR